MTKTAVKKIKLTLVRSAIGFPEPQKATVRALGFRRLHQTVEQDDTPVIRGMIAKIVHLLRIQE